MTFVHGPLLPDLRSCVNASRIGWRIQSGRNSVSLIDVTKQEIEQLVGLSGSDVDAFWALSRKCSVLALAPAVAAGATWGPGLVAMGTVALPGIGTISGTSAALL